mgnify:CR=1 FL=1
MTKKILFVCLGNICRSPLAQGIAEAQALAQAIPAELDSAGTGGWHIGHPPDPRAIVAARTRGYEISEQTSRRLRKRDFDEFDLIIAMDRNNLRDLLELQPANSHAKLHLMTDVLNDAEMRDVPDPYYTGRFMPIIDQLEAAMAGLLGQFRALAQ